MTAPFDTTTDPRDPRFASGGDDCVLLGDSAVMRRVRARIAFVSRFQDVSVLVLGETGVGKELVAQEIHRQSGGGRGPFVPVDCASIPMSLFESELFGHEAGSFTGAKASRVGLFEQAHGGTIFLDEIGEMPAAMQPKLLRVLESRKLRRVGSNDVVPFTARVVSATNRVVAGERHDGTLRRDLYYRLAAYTISLPPLRERPEDIPLLAHRFIARFADRHRIVARELRSDAVQILTAHPWPGNIRELRAVTEQLAMTEGGPIEGADVDAVLLERTPSSQPRSDDPLTEVGRDEVAGTPSRTMPMITTVAGTTSRLAYTLRPAGAAAPVTLRERERDIVVEALHQSGGNLSRTARKLGIARSTLRHKLRRYGIELPRSAADDDAS